MATLGVFLDRSSFFCSAVWRLATGVLQCSLAPVLCFVFGQFRQFLLKRLLDELVLYPRALLVDLRGLGFDLPSFASLRSAAERSNDTSPCAGGFQFFTS